VLSWKGCDAAENEWYGHPVNQDLTFFARRADWMEQPRIPVWAYAGIPFRLLNVLDKYVSPNDKWVGESSALGTHANLGTNRHRLWGGDWHGGQLGSQDVADKLKAALTELLSGRQGLLRTSAVAAAAKRGKAKRGKAKPRRGNAKRRAGKGKRRAGKGKQRSGKRRPKAKTTRLRLRFAEPAERLKRRTTRVGTGLLVTRIPFSAACPRGVVESFDMGGGLHGAYTRGRCGLVGIDPRDAVFMAAGRARGVRGAAVYRRGAKPTVTVTVRGADKAKIQVGRRRALPLEGKRKARKASRGPQTIVLKARRLRGRSAFVRVRVGKRSFSARLPSGD
jgi:hypothetical protein